MKNAVDKGNNHVLIIGDFNYPEINWLAETSPSDIHHPATAFMECIRDTYLIPHVTDPTHYRRDQRPNILDLILTNEEGMISNISQTAPLGKSHHVCVHFNLNCYTDAPERNTPRHLYHKGDYDRMREEARTLSWYDTDRVDVDKSCRLFTNNIKTLAEKYIPKVRATTEHKTKRPIYMTNEALAKIRAKTVYFKKWRHEKKLAKEVKRNPKAFFKYAQTKLKTRSGIHDLVTEDGITHTTENQKANVLNEFFSSVFTKEDAGPLPEFVDIYDATLENITIRLEDVQKKLKHLNVNKSCGPDDMHPRILYEPREPLTDIFQHTISTGSIRYPTNGNQARLHQSSRKAINYRPVSLTSIPCKILE